MAKDANNPTVEQITALLREGQTLNTKFSQEVWAAKVLAFLRSATSEVEADAFAKLKSTHSDSATHALHVGHLQGLLAKLHIQEPIRELNSSRVNLNERNIANSRRVFVVHGHDDAAKDGVARFISRLGLDPVILHEQASSGRTIIEKFEQYSDDIAFAVVLLTPDDEGKIANTSDVLRPRARQNVIIELGYFMGRLGRSRVCALHKGGVELPSDYQGVIYIDMDSGGGWKAKLAQEFVQAKMPISLEGLIGS